MRQWPSYVLKWEWKKPSNNVNKQIEIMKLKFISNLLLMISFALVGGFITQSAQGAVLAVAASVALHYLLQPISAGVLFDIPLPTLDPETVIKEVTKFAGKYSKTFLRQTLNGLDVFKDLNIDRMVSRQGKLLPKITFKAGMRPLDTDVEDNKGSEREVGGRMLYVKDCMKLFHYKPEDIIQTFMSDMLAPGAKMIPFQQQFWMGEMERLAAEINDNWYFNEDHQDAPAFDPAKVGGYAAGDYVKYRLDGFNNFYRANAAAAAGESPLTHPAKWDEMNQLACFDGHGTILAKEITAGTVIPLVTGALTATDAYDQIESMYDEIPVAVRNKGGKIRMSHASYRYYIKDERTKYAPVATPGMGDEKKVIYGDRGRWTIEPASWMGGSGRVIFDVEGKNLWAGSNLASVPGVTKSIETLHGTKSVAKWQLGAEFADLETLYVNDQD